MSYNSLFIIAISSTLLKVSKIEKRYKQEVSLLGERIRSIRTAKGLSQLDLEIVSGINRTEISRIENGQKNIEFLTLVKLAFFLEVEMSEIFNGEKSKISN